MFFTSSIISNLLSIFLFLGFFFLGLRTLLWHLQNWQIREYRWDRVKSYFKTKEGFENLYNFWFFRGILPRPKFTGRIFLILCFFAVLSFLEIYLLDLGLEHFYEDYYLLFREELFFCSLFLFFFERTIFLLVFMSVMISKIPVYFRTKKLFNLAKNIIDNKDPQIKIIGITGSFGKSSTKEILVHLLKNSFGAESVLFNPENQNNEVAIARLIVKNKKFFELSDKAQNLNLERSVRNDNERKSGKGVHKFFVCEVGAYKKGEIKKVCDFLRPHIGIITGINQQHMELFGSQKNITEGKFELAESVSEKIFFPAQDRELHSIFRDRKIQATPLALDLKALKNIKSDPAKTSFELYGERFVLPWPGEFFIKNAFLSLECLRELGVNRKKIPRILSSIPPLERALSIKKLDQVTILEDLYSCNVDGVFSAIDHLKKFSGKKIFIGKPLLELGGNSRDIHRKIFEKLKEIKAVVFWEKDDFSSLGKEILGQNFYSLETEKGAFFVHKMLKKLGAKDVVLLESKLSSKTLKLFAKAQ